MEEQTAPEKGVPARTSSDTGLLLTAVILALLVVASVTYLGYSILGARSIEQASTPTSRAIDAMYADMQANPGDVVLRVRLAEALAAAGRYSEATRELEAAIQIDPEHTGAHLMMGIVAMTQRQFSAAEPYFNEVIRLTTNIQFQDASERRELAFFYLGEIALSQSRYDDAAGYFIEALRIRRDSSVTYLNLGLALKGMDEIPGAIENLENALVFDPTYAQAHYALGQIYLAKDDKVNAATHLALAARYAPDQEEVAQALVSLGSADQWSATALSALAEDDLDRALEAALIARTLDEEMLDYVKVHGQVLEASGSLDDAREVYEEALEMKADDAEVLAALERLGRTGSSETER